MKMYFLSCQPCILTVNGTYFGVCDAFERSANVALEDRLFLQFTPENARPVAFFLTPEIRFSPPDGVCVYLLKEGIALYIPAFAPLDNALRPVRQTKTDGGVATLFFQGELHLSLQTNEGLFVTTLPPSFADCKITYTDDVFLLQTQTAVAVYSKRAERLLTENASQCQAKNGKLYLETPLCERLGRTAICVYDLQNGCTRESYTLRQTRTESGENDTEKLREELLAYAFFESVLIGAEYAEFLSDELRERKEDVRAFLGDFLSVTRTNEANECGLVKEKQPRLFQVDYFKVRIENGKICDIFTD